MKPASAIQRATRPLGLRWPIVVLAAVFIALAGTSIGCNDSTADPQGSFSAAEILYAAAHAAQPDICADATTGSNDSNPCSDCKCGHQCHCSSVPRSGESAPAASPAAAPDGNSPLELGTVHNAPAPATRGAIVARPNSGIERRFDGIPVYLSNCTFLN